METSTSRRPGRIRAAVTAVAALTGVAATIVVLAPPASAAACVWAENVVSGPDSDFNQTGSDGRGVWTSRSLYTGCGSIVAVWRFSVNDVTGDQTSDGYCGALARAKIYRPESTTRYTAWASMCDGSSEVIVPAGDVSVGRRFRIQIQAAWPIWTVHWRTIVSVRR